MQKQFYFLFLFSTFYFSSQGQCPTNVEVTHENCQMTLEIEGDGEYYLTYYYWAGTCYMDYLGPAGTYVINEYFPLCFQNDSEDVQTFALAFYDPGVYNDWCPDDYTVCSWFDGPDCEFIEASNHVISTPECGAIQFEVSFITQPEGMSYDCHDWEDYSYETYYTMSIRAVTDFYPSVPSEFIDGTPENPSDNFYYYTFDPIYGLDVDYEIELDINNCFYSYDEFYLVAELCPCGDPLACNYGGVESDFVLSCNYDDVPGCIDTTACNFDPSAGCDNGSCLYGVLGCTDSNSCNFNVEALCDDGSCEGTYGCTDSNACGYDLLATCDDGSCLYGEILGCTLEFACNYDSLATCNDGSCSIAEGCIDSSACNYWENAVCDDSSCTYPGCMDSSAINYDSLAGCDDGSCAFFADANGDGSVDILDLAFIINDFGCTSDCEGDINGDGFTNILDIVMFSSYF